ncbi:MAG: 4-(cytidine 5'-diphospho)-2-C-methyl-D-erythritol kinase [Longimicrobiales bacterium]
MRGDAALDVLAHAKLNLSLRVLARETSGYHQIETMYCALEFADEIEISRTAEGVSLEVVSPAGQAGLPPDPVPLEQNLAWRAAALFARAAAVTDGIHVRLTKRIPAGAGLGGGSSDAAAVLSALNQLHDKPLAARELLALGAQLGSDVPFFLTGATLALGWGRGGRMVPLAPLPAAPVVLAVPPERVSTAAAYAALAVTDASAPAIIDAPHAWSDMAKLAHNDFEDVVFPQQPRLPLLRQILQDAGAVIARMTGTGSVVFGVFADVAAADAAARRVTDSHPDVETVVTRTRGLGAGA